MHTEKPNVAPRAHALKVSWHLLFLSGSPQTHLWVQDSLTCASKSKATKFSTAVLLLQNLLFSPCVLQSDGQSMQDLSAPVVPWSLYTHSFLYSLLPAPPRTASLQDSSHRGIQAFNKMVDMIPCSPSLDESSRDYVKMEMGKHI